MSAPCTAHSRVAMGCCIGFNLKFLNLCAASKSRRSLMPQPFLALVDQKNRRTHCCCSCCLLIPSLWKQWQRWPLRRSQVSPCWLEISLQHLFITCSRGCSRSRLSNDPYCLGTRSLGFSQPMPMWVRAIRKTVVVAVVNRIARHWQLPSRRRRRRRRCRRPFPLKRWKYISL